MHRHKTEPIFQQLSIIQSTGKHITLHQVHLSTCIIYKPQECVNKHFIILFIHHHTNNVQHQTSSYTHWGTLGESASHSSCSLNTSTHSLQVRLQLLPQDDQVQCGSSLSHKALWDGLGDHWTLGPCLWQYLQPVLMGLYIYLFEEKLLVRKTKCDRTRKLLNFFLSI